VCDVSHTVKGAHTEQNPHTKHKLSNPQQKGNTSNKGKGKVASRPPTRDRDSDDTGAHSETMLKESAHLRAASSSGGGSGCGWVYSSLVRQLFINRLPVLTCENKRNNRPREPQVCNKPDTEKQRAGGQGGEGGGGGGGGDGGSGDGVGRQRGTDDCGQGSGGDGNDDGEVKGNIDGEGTTNLQLAAGDQVCVDFNEALGLLVLRMRRPPHPPAPPASLQPPPTPLKETSRTMHTRENTHMDKGFLSADYLGWAWDFGGQKGQGGGDRVRYGISGQIPGDDGSCDEMGRPCTWSFLGAFLGVPVFVCTHKRTCI